MNPAELFRQEPNALSHLLISDECRDSVIWNQRDPAQLSALPNAYEFPEPLLLALVIIAATKPKIWIEARLREAEKLRSWVRRSIRAFASRFFYRFNNVHRDQDIRSHFNGVGRRCARFVRFQNSDGNWLGSFFGACHLRSGFWQTRSTFWQFCREKICQARLRGFVGISPTNWVRSRPSCSDSLRPCLPFLRFDRCSHSTTSCCK